MRTINLFSFFLNQEWGRIVAVLETLPYPGHCLESQDLAPISLEKTCWMVISVVTTQLLKET